MPGRSTLTINTDQVDGLGGAGRPGFFEQKNGGL